jgi:hypothetical protein
MIDISPADWVLLEAAKRCDWPYDVDVEDGGITELRADYHKASKASYLHRAFRALCDNIAKHEQPPVDRKVLCAREAWRLYAADHVGTTEDACRLAIELWEEGFGA